MCKKIIFFFSVKREFDCQGKTLEVKKAEEKPRDDGMGGTGRGGKIYNWFWSLLMK